MATPGLRVLIAGATGLVGRHCLERLRSDPRVERVVSLQRRAGEAGPKLDIECIDFERIDALEPAAFVADVALCALGSTIRQAGSQAAFRRVDHDYTLGFARLAQRSGVTAFGLVSALGADPASRVFYNHVKGEAEAAVATLGFASLVIARPSLLLGARAEVRTAERAFAPLSRLLPRRWRGVPATAVARALVDAVLEPVPGLTRLENDRLLAAGLLAAG